MLPQLYALHVHAARRGDGLRNEFFRHCGDQALMPLPTTAQISGPAPVAAPANTSRELRRGMTNVARQVESTCISVAKGPLPGSALPVPSVSEGPGTPLTRRLNRM